MRILRIAVMAVLLVLAILLPLRGGPDQDQNAATLRGSGSHPFFTIVVATDVHVYPDPTTAQSAAWAASTRWATNPAIRAAWNIVGWITTGDHIITDPGTTDDYYQQAATGYQTLQNAGLPFIVTPGNHDIQPYAHAQWDSYLAPFNLGATFHADSQNIGMASSTHTSNSVTYLRINAPTSAGVFKMSLVGEGLFASAADVAQARTWMDADQDRQFIVGMHIFTVGAQDATKPPNDVHLCQYDECVATNGTGFQDGVDIWNELKDNPRIVTVMSGHWHYPVYLHLTGTAGNPVETFANYNECNPTTASIITLLRFRPLDHKFDIISWDAIKNIPDTRWNGNGTATYDWDPLESPQKRPAGEPGRGRGQLEVKRQR